MTPTIRKRLTVFLALTMLLSLLSGVVAAVGSMDDPLITKSYIENTFFGELSAAITNRVSEADQRESPAVGKLQTIRDDALDKISLERLADLAADALWNAVDTKKFSAPAVNHQRQIVLSPGDTLNALPGATVKVLSGRVQTRNGVGATVVQIASAKELYNQWELSEGDYLLVTEQGAIGFTAILGDATIMVTGEFLIEHGEPYTAQFTDLADALNKMGLFLGSGKGYELDRVSRRDEGLIMLLRLLGDEAAALELAEVTHPFTDVRPWAADYVSFDNEYVRMTAFKKAEERNTAILRFFNTQGEAVTLTAEVSPAFTGARLTNLNEVAQSDLTITDGKLVMEIPAKKIVTVELY